VGDRVVKTVDHDLDTLGNLNTINVSSGVPIAISNVNRMRQTSYRGFSSKKWKEASPIPFKSTFRYLDDVLPLSNSKFGDFVDRIYPIG